MAQASVQLPDQTARLTLVGDSCIDATDHLAKHHELLLRGLEDGAAVELDLTGVSRMDTAGLQVVLAFVLEMRRLGRRVVIASASDGVRQCAKLAGVGVVLGIEPI